MRRGGKTWRTPQDAAARVAEVGAPPVEELDDDEPDAEPPCADELLLDDDDPEPPADSPEVPFDSPFEGLDDEPEDDSELLGELPVAGLPGMLPARESVR